MTKPLSEPSFGRKIAYNKFAASQLERRPSVAGGSCEIPYAYLYLIDPLTVDAHAADESQNVFPVSLTGTPGQNGLAINAEQVETATEYLIDMQDYGMYQLYGSVRFTEQFDGAIGLYFHLFNCTFLSVNEMCNFYGAIETQTRGRDVRYQSIAQTIVVTELDTSPQAGYYLRVSNQTGVSREIDLAMFVAFRVAQFTSTS